MASAYSDHLIFFEVLFAIVHLSFCIDLSFYFQEAFGRYLDLHELFNQFINSKFGDPSTEYAAYLDVFSQPHKIPRKQKLTR
jgi:hypothetical protein